jgi:hypothetical protein
MQDESIDNGSVEYGKDFINQLFNKSDDSVQSLAASQE